MSETTMRCPYCGGSVPPAETICPDCHEDLAALVRLRLEYAIYYNEALSLAREGHLEAARARLILSLERNARFLPAQRLVTKVAAALGDWPLARRSAARALDLAPEDDLVRRLAAEVEAEAERNTLKGTAPTRTHTTVARRAAGDEPLAHSGRLPDPSGAPSAERTTSLWASLFPWMSRKDKNVR